MVLIIIFICLRKILLVEEIVVLDKEETDPATSPSVALLLDAYGDPVNSADENTITLYGNLISDGGSSITSWGFRYSLSINGSNQLVTPITTASITSGTAFEKVNWRDYPMIQLIIIRLMLPIV